MWIDRARDSDIPAVESLLAAAALPLEGVAEALALGVVGRDGGRVIGAAAIERYGHAGLLRSVVVAGDCRGRGTGRRIVEAAEKLARSVGIRELYLLTETAIEWFPRLGYEPLERADAAAVVGGSVEFTTVCKDRGVAMRKALVAEQSRAVATTS